MFILRTWKEINKAMSTAEKIRPQVVAEAEGVYRVTGRQGSEFRVFCFKNIRGQRVVDCGCVAGQKYQVACFHSAAAVRAHVSLVTWNRPAF